MKKEWLIKTLVIGIILLFIILSVVPSTAFNNPKKSFVSVSDGVILYVGGSGSGNYSRIQDAIDDASDGDTVFVYDDMSPYNENLMITKSIVLLGENKLTTIIHGDAYYYYQIIYAIGQNIMISDFTIQNAAIGILCEELNNSQISNLIIDNTVCAVYLWRSSQNTISNIRVISCYEYCIYLYNHSSNNKIINNSLANSAKNGVSLIGSCDKNLIEKNSIEEKEIGLVIVWSFFNLIKKNNFINNSIQAYFNNSSYNLFFKNYWDDWSSFRPRPIEGIRYWPILKKTTPWKIFDWHPAKEPFNIVS